MLERQIPDGPSKIEVGDAWGLVGIEKSESVNKLTKAHHVAMRAAMAGLGFTRKDGGLRNAAGRTVRAYVRGDPHLTPWWSPGNW